MTETKRKKFIKDVRKALIDKGMSQKELAIKLGITSVYMNMLLRSIDKSQARIANLEMVGRIKKELNIK